MGCLLPISRRSFRLQLLLACAAGSLILAEAADAAEPTSSVQEIVVTAQRRTERLENVPMAVTVLSAETIKNAAVGLQDLGHIAPGVVVSMNGGNTQPSIRGISTLPNGGFVENNVAIYVDGIYQPEGIGINTDFANVANVQVLKGPQGTLYGRNATGGAILINTLPASKTLTGSLEASYARLDEKVFSGYLSGPVSERLRYSLAAYSRDSNGRYKLSSPVTGRALNENSAPIKKQGVRVRLEGDLTDSLTAAVGYSYALSSDASALQFTPFAHVATTLPAPPLRAPNANLKSSNSPLLVLDENQQATLHLTWRTGIGTLTSASGFSHINLKQNFDTEGTYAELARTVAGISMESYQTNLNYEITAIPNVDLVVGGYFLHDDRDTDYTYVVTRAVITSLLYNRSVREAYQVYADGTYHLGDRLSLTAGIGYASEDASVDFWTRTPAQVLTGAYTTAPIHKKTNFKKATPRASVRYELAPQTNVYASYSQGFKAGLWQFSSAPINPVRQEKVSAYEVGFKTARPGFRFDTAAFYYDYKDIQVSVNIPDPLCTTPPNCVIRSLFFNGPRSHIYGIDGQLTVNPTDRLTLRAGAAYVHARYLAFRNATGTGLNPVTDVNVASQTQDWSHQQMPRAPTFSGNLGVDYEVDVPYGALRFGANASYTSSYVVSNPSTYGPLAGSLANKQRYRQSAYALVDASLTWTEPSGHLSLGVFGRNLTNKKFWVNYLGNANGDYGQWGPPRILGARARYRF